MKNTLIFITLFFIILYSNAQLKPGSFVLKLSNDGYKETITLKKKGTSVTARLKNGGIFSGTWDANNNKLTGFIKLNNFIKNPYKFNAFVKNNTNGNLIVGKYCHCTHGETNLFMTLKRVKEITYREWVDIQADQQEKSTNMQGTWSTTYGELRLHQSGDRITGDYKNVGTINARITGDFVKGTFTNGSNSGIFEWYIDKDKKSFTGKWAWKGRTLSGEWNGTLKSTKKPILKN